MTHHVAVIGTGAVAVPALRRKGFTDIVLLRSVAGRSFDDTAHVWRLRTADGVDHTARIVIDETAEDHSPRPYLGVAVHGVPNRFLVGGPDEARYVAECLRVMDRRSSTRIEVRYSTQRIFDQKAPTAVPWRRVAGKIPSAFHLGSHSGADEEVFDGEALVRAGAIERRARVRLLGNVNPVDGRFHWQGTIFDEFDDAPRGAVTVTVGDHSAEGRITERSPWGTSSVRGVGPPPFPVETVDLAVPQV